MRKALLRLATLGIVLAPLAFAQPAHADPYRWCAEYGRAGGRNCYFLTLEQCRMTVSGIGGACVLNQFYTGPENGPVERPARHYRAPRKHYREY